MNEKLRHQQKQESQTEQEQQQVSKAQEFSSVEEMLRADAAQINVPTRVAEKLNQSIGAEPPQNKSWWKRLLGN
ncbi:MAG: hypothetical protein H0X66_14305 [Verrucomicrobia bacterium]|nr:hypothetical protein [Verrucomicrobiota bacterium]